MNNTVTPIPGVSIVAYDNKDQVVYTVTAADLPTYNGINFPKVDSVQYYLIGNGTTRLEARSPFLGMAKAGVAGVALTVINDFIYVNRNADKTDQYTVKLVVGTWDDMVTNVCTPGSSCPDIVFIGSTQVAGQAANQTIVQLDSFFDEYTKINSWLLKDAFSKVRVARNLQITCLPYARCVHSYPKYLQFTYYDYTYGVPLTTDMRLLYYNTTTFNKLGLTHPPPVGTTWGDEWWSTWNWYELRP
ncbi:hypothetical protein BC936DRAFT_137415 [Jimgerdemannia flammicorona]|uniref:Uncharacterized protein n=2 Tax=Jimgerdemannia flammicorona TaxID=994334 RepID=A0A433QK76_9FUNG|nr:hypothetical protein BC936DRAFT_137415 [Jimgerdemannia flammicorona]RUS30181.1 hypothetical protein BC938DRAFT_479763 [Jimgerdemannia flammicorona]